MIKMILFVFFISTNILIAEEVKLIPVKTLPTIVRHNGITYFNTTPNVAVMAGYRLIPVKPEAPEGKRVATETLIQDDKKADFVKWDIVYEDIPEVIVVPIEAPVITNIASDKVEFQFTTSGQFIGIKWLDAPVTNEVSK